MATKEELKALFSSGAELKSENFSVLIDTIFDNEKTVAPEGTSIVETIDYSKLNKAEIQELLVERDIKFDATANKDELLKLLEETNGDD